MYCKNCGYEVNDGAAVCMHCGVLVGMGNRFCQHCGFEPDPQAVICVNCGRELKKINSYYSPISNAPKYRMGDALKSCFKKYATFKGRSRRAEFWNFTLFYIMLRFVTTILCAIGLTMIMVGVPERERVEIANPLCFIGLGIFVIINAFIYLPYVSVMVRRLHDTGRSGWNYWFSFLPPIGLILLLIWCCEDSQPGNNEYGPNPKE